MPTLLSSADRDALLQRLRRLQPDSRALWGTLTAPRMLCHLLDSSRVALGETSARREDSFLSRTLVKWLVIHTPVKPPPGKVQTAPEMLRSTPGNWSTDLAHVAELLTRMGTNRCTAVHPFFGPLSPAQWARLGWKHADHHLRQFGV